MLSGEIKLKLSQFSTHRTTQHAAALATLALFSAILFFHHVDTRGLWSSHEGRAGQHAQWMLDTGHWGMPTLYYGQSDYQKPPMYYWMVSAVAWWRGGEVDAWSIRAPAAISALLCVWLVYALGTWMWRPGSGFVAALMLASNLRYSWLARVGRIDMPLALMVSIVLVCFWLAYHQPLVHSSNDRPARRWRWMLAAYMAAALAIMLKGPVGLVLPIASICLFLVFERQAIWPWKRGFGALMHRLGVWWGVPLVLALTGPWFVWATVVTHGGFFKTFFLHHHWDRTWGTEGLKAGPVWYYIPQIFIDMFPWSILIPPAIVAALGGRRDGKNSWDRYVLSWALGMFVFLSLVRFKRHDYLLPILPGLALLLAGYWDRLCEASGAPANWRWPKLFGMTVVACAVVASLFTVVIRDDAITERFIESLFAHRFMQETDRMVFSQLGHALNGLPWSAIGVVGIVAVACFIGALAIQSRRPVAAVTLLSAAWAGAFLLYIDFVLPPLEPLREQRSLAEMAREFRPSDCTLYYYGREDQQLMFYLGAGVRWLPDRTTLRPLLKESEPVFVVMELGRFQMRQKEWPEVMMVPLARNTDNPFGTHRDPAVLVTNATGWRLVKSRRSEAVWPRAN